MRDPVLIDEYHHQRERALDAARDAYLEDLQEEIKTDPELRVRLAVLYAERFDSELPDRPFMDWAAHRLFDERTPQWEGGWSK